MKHIAALGKRQDYWRYVMTGDTQTIEQIVAQTQRLSPDDRVRLIQRVAETLIPTLQKSGHRQLIYGEFRGENMSTEQDFLLAEWHPSDEELDGP
jgi:hypothetical protein